MSRRVHVLPQTVISRYSNTYAKKSKAPWDWRTAAWAAENGHLHILEYLVERKFDKYGELACQICSRERPLRLFAVLTRNRQSALGLCGRTSRSQEQTHRMCTIPPRQRLPITRRLAIRTWRATHDLKSQVSFINKKRIRERRNSFRFRTREIREYTQRDIEIWYQKQLRIEIKRNTRTKSKKKTCHHADFSRNYLPFSTVFVSLLKKGVVVLGYKTLNFICSFFLSSSFLGKPITCCFKDTSSIIYSYEKRV